MEDGYCLVFTEVRFRNENRMTTAALSVDHHKQRKILRTAAVFLGRHPKYSNYAVRFDVVGFDESEGRVSVVWIKDAFRPT